MTGENGSVGYELRDEVATITVDDGKVNALSLDVLTAIEAHLDVAEASSAKAVILAGREGTFSAGFDLRTAPEGWPEMIIAGAVLSKRMLAFPKPIVAACTGSAIAMGAFLLLAADHRVGAAGEARIGLTEVAIGLTMPWFGIELARHRLTPPYNDRCVNTAALLGPEEARAAGFLDQVVPTADLGTAVLEAATALSKLNLDAHAVTKLRTRKAVLAGIGEDIERLQANTPEMWREFAAPKR